MTFSCAVFKDWEIALDAICPTDHYISSYPELLRAAKCLEKNFEEKSVPEESVPMVAHLAYGWMPTALTYPKPKHPTSPKKDKNQFEIDPQKKEEFNQKIYNVVRASKKVTTISNKEEALNLMEKMRDPPPINNSWVGLSKTLHFFNPEIFPILDSNVALAFNISTYGKYNKRDVYVDYMEFVHQNRKKEFVEPVLEEFEKKAGYKISEVRAVEFILFNIGQKKKKEKKEKELKKMKKKKNNQ